LALFLSDRLIRPVRDLTDAAQRMAQGDLTQRVPTRGNDELAQLGQAFNDMADSLEEAVENRKAMTADIAHELRNPLAVQRAHLEALQDGIYSPTAESLQPIYEQNLLLTRLVDDLRILALADAGQLQLDRTLTDVVVLAGQIAERFNPQAAARNIHLSLQVARELQEKPAMMVLDPLRIEQILGNLLSNALRHTPQGGNISMDISSRVDRVLIQVADNGPGISPEALPHIFERFYRADEARSRSEGGSGLGLAIARQLAEMHGGTLSAANTPLGGAVFTLSLPRQTHS
jgi:signal transduction histidine kinase